MSRFAWFAAAVAASLALAGLWIYLEYQATEPSQYGTDNELDLW